MFLSYCVTIMSLFYFVFPHQSRLRILRYRFLSPTEIVGAPEQRLYFGSVLDGGRCSIVDYSVTSDLAPRSIPSNEATPMSVLSGKVLVAPVLRRYAPPEPSHLRPIRHSPSLSSSPKVGFPIRFTQATKASIMLEGQRIMESLRYFHDLAKVRPSRTSADDRPYFDHRPTTS
ncbi:hypothetical protein CROQUDRAFT_103659 [Cronartium quercuum f. sp. fusiforme G11]|uniref:Uncharacterized protein n=1 Tax=Cronartium quercuum f. sp. fusiforme G11 TaxID=708437 RepID=A0A9P6NQ82_9BASI|nr:hypothetical protein CROQUDRAFT_103659 [Cronartium quercuum f. sp. fusiforme G11]